MFAYRWRESHTATPSRHPHMTDSQDARRWLILAAVALAQLMIVLDVTVVNIALPSAQADLSFGDDSRQWVITAYALAFGSLLLLGGRISDLVGRKQAFVVGLLGFAGASAVGGAAPSFEVLVGARAVQGSFAALLAPAVLSILTTTFTDPAERAKAFGVHGAIGGSGAAVGLLLGGVLTQLLDWRWTMYVNVAFAVGILAAGVLATALLFDRQSSSGQRPCTPRYSRAASSLSRSLSPCTPSRNSQFNSRTERPEPTSIAQPSQRISPSTANSITKPLTTRANGIP